MNLQGFLSSQFFMIFKKHLVDDSMECVSCVDGEGNAMDSMKRLTPAAHFRRILDIIVDEGEIMEKFQGGCRNNRIFRIASHHFAAEKNQCRPEPLPPLSG